MTIEKENIMSMGAGTPVVMLHSSLGSKLQWYKLMRRISNKYLTLAVDLYGYGESPFPENPGTFSLKDEVEFVSSVLGEVLPPGETFYLVGHSYGAATALQYCHLFPEKVIGLALYEPVSFHLLADDDEAKIQARQTETIVNRLLNQGKDTEAVSFFVDYWSGESTFGRLPKEIQRSFLRVLRKLPLDFRALVNAPATLENYRNILQPVCLIAGRRSPMDSRRIAHLLARTIPDCRFHQLNAGHLGPLEKPELVNPIIDEFLHHVSSRNL